MLFIVIINHGLQQLFNICRFQFSKLYLVVVNITSLSRGILLTFSIPPKLSQVQRLYCSPQAKVTYSPIFITIEVQETSEWILVLLDCLLNFKTKLSCFSHRRKVKQWLQQPCIKCAHALLKRTEELVWSQQFV